MDRILCAMKFVLASGLMIIVLGACNSSSDSDNQTVTISDIGWVIENIDQSYWSTQTDLSAFINFWIYFEEEDLTAADVQSVAFVTPTGDAWVFDDSSDIEDNFYSAEDCFGGWLRLCTSYYSDDGSVLPIGAYTIVVTLTNGNYDAYPFSMPAPGSTQTESMSYVYTEDYADAASPPDGYTSLPLRATIGSAVADTTSSTLTVGFSVDDTLIYNGCIWMYDADGNGIGTTASYFRDFATGGIPAFLNSGNAFYTDGPLNVIELTEDDITFYQDYTFQDIYEIRVVLSDGYQYELSERTYDTRSISQNFVVSTQ